RAASSISSQLSEARAHSEDIEKMGAFIGKDIAQLIREVLDSASVSSSGSMLTGSVKMSLDPLIKIAKGETPMPFGMGGFGGNPFGGGAPVGPRGAGPRGALPGPGGGVVIPGP